MGTYSQQNIRAPKGESRGTGRNYQGRFQKSYLDTMNDRLSQKQADAIYLQRKFDEAKGGKNADTYAKMLDRARREVGQFEVLVASIERQEKAEDPDLCASCGKPGIDGICDNCVFAEDIRWEEAPSPFPFGRNEMTDAGADPSMRDYDENEDDWRAIQ